MQPRKVLVIGLGRFGGALADELWDADTEPGLPHLISPDSPRWTVSSTRTR